MSRISQAGLDGDSRYARDDLVAELFVERPPDIWACLLKSSIQDRFNTLLCDAVSIADVDTDPTGMSGVDFVMSQFKGKAPAGADAGDVDFVST